MRKDNYLYFLTENGKLCDNGSKELKSRNLIQIKNIKIGNIATVKRGNKFHFIYVCKNSINEKFTKETLQNLSLK